MPDSFIPMLEESGNIFELDYYVYDKAFQWLKKWNDSTQEKISLSLNISPLHMKRPDELIRAIFSKIYQYELDTKYIVLEITETAFIHYPEQVNHIIEYFHEHGIRISMDDFGSGYSSLNSLKDIHFDEIKLDKKFLEDGLSGNGTIVLQEIFHMLKRMNKSIVCEGVETRETAEFLIEEGCDELQGYYFYKPICEEKFRELLLA